jgi:FkbM family methyltransferase
MIKGPPPWERLAYKTCTNKHACMFSGQGAEDRFTFEHFFSKEPFLRNGTFVEMGAVDGVLYSNTLFFERILGWSGLLVEPSPRLIPALRRNRGQNDRNLVVNAAVCATEGMVEWWDVPKNPTVSGIRASMPDGVILDSAGHVAFGGTARGTLPHRTNITCEPLTALLRKAGIIRINLFSLDVQGAELSVLSTMNWSIPIDVLIVEQDGLDAAKDHAVRSLLRSHDYHYSGRLGFNWSNEVWLSREFQQIHPPPSGSRHHGHDSVASWTSRGRMCFFDACL